MAKLGRPIVGKPLTINIVARIDKDTDNKLIEYCKKNNMTKTEVLRLGLKIVLDNKRKI